MKHCPACKGYGRVAPLEDPEAPASKYVLCRKCGGAGRIRQGPPDYHATITPLDGGRLALVCAGEANARPWVNLLTRAGVELEHAEHAGVYVLTFAEAPAWLMQPTPAEERPFYWLDDPGPAPQETPAGPAGDPVRDVLTWTLASIAQMCGFCFNPGPRDVRAAKLAAEALDMLGITDPAAWLAEHGGAEGQP